MVRRAVFLNRGCHDAPERMRRRGTAGAIASAAQRWFMEGEEDRSDGRWRPSVGLVEGRVSRLAVCRCAKKVRRAAGSVIID